MSERDIFLGAIDIHDPAARSAYLDGVCGGDAALRGRVEALLRSHDEAGSFLDLPILASPNPDVGPTRACNSSAADPGDGPTRTEGADAEFDTDDALGFLAPAQRPDSLGRIGHYEVLEVLGRGGFGIVFRAFDDNLQRVVAVKVLAPSMAATSPARKRFLREARSAALIEHENVVRIHETSEQPLPYLVMEFVPGETLQERLDRTGPLEVAEALKIARQVAEGLAAAHEKGLIHRDIKPSNILIESGPQERAKITDFGLARAADDASLTRSGVVAGTPMYMAPEQAKGESLDHRADLFSLGSVLYAMLTGHPPFRAETTLAVLKRVAEDTPRPMREVIPEVPEWLCRIVEKLHAKNPTERFQTAREVADVLADCEKQLQAHKELTDFSRIPGSAPAPDTPQWNWWLMQLAAVAPLLACILLYSLQPEEWERVRSWVGPVGLTLLLVGWVVAVQVIPLPLPTATHPAASQRRYRWVLLTKHEMLWGPRKWGLLGLFATVAVAAVLFYRNHEPESGVVAIQTNDPDVVISLDGQVIMLSMTSVPEGVQHAHLRSTTVGVRVGEHRLWAIKNNKLVHEETFTISPGQTKLIEIAKPEPPTPPEPKEEWVQLFNGRDLTGWKTHPDQPGEWRVEAGGLVGSSESALFTQRGDFENFHLRFETNVISTGMAGVICRAAFAIDPNWGPLGYEATTFPQPGLLLSGVERLGGVAADIEPGIWFTEEVIVTGNRIVIKVNGVTTKEYTDTNRTFTNGHLALWVVGHATDRVRFRKIEIKELPASSPAPPPAVVPFDATKAKEHQEAWAKQLGVPVEATNAIGMKLRLIPPGEFTMGATPAEFELFKAEDHAAELKRQMPNHTVKLTKPYQIGATEVTVGQFRRFVKDTKYKTEAETDGTGGDVIAQGKHAWKAGIYWDKPGYEHTDDCPVTQVSWNDAAEFCNWLSRKEGLPPAYVKEANGWRVMPGPGYRLPTEAEWEFACRAGSRTSYFFGDDPKQVGDYAWHKGNADGHPHSVGEKRSNPFGLFDVLGNVREWVADWDDDKYVPQPPVTDPQGAAVGTRRVMRGSGWSSTPIAGPSAFRSHTFPRLRLCYLGFRVARTTDPHAAVTPATPPKP